MTEKQKETILPLLRRQEEEGRYTELYLIAYEEYLDTEDTFTDFWCERAEGKQQYTEMIAEVVKRDAGAKVFVEVYGFEEEEDGSDIFIYAETMILLTELLDEQIQQVMDGAGDIFPSELGEVSQENDALERAFVIDAAGCKLPLMHYLQEKQRILYYGWD